MASTMDQNVKWALEQLKQPTRVWHLLSSITFVSFGIFSKVMMQYLNKTAVYNKEHLIKVLDDRPTGTPVITVSNHHSCADDPALWGVLRIGQVCNKNVMRWSLAAHDICFVEKRHSMLFAHGKCIPCVRGDGVYQPAVDLCIDKLRQGEWVHIFPEGKVNMTKEVLRFKWGVGRMVYESPKVPIIVPIWHIGMDDLLPNTPPYVPKPGQHITYNFGKPLDLTETVEHVRREKFDEVQARKYITDTIQEEMFRLRDETEKLHKDRIAAAN